MKALHIPFQETGFFSKTMQDYLEEKATIQSYYGNFPNIENFKKQMAQKEELFSSETRQVLVEVLQAQYAHVNTSETTQQNIASLLHSNTFTVTTGHQLNLFTGPLYFLYKIISAINLAETLQEEYPTDTFVPVYWMATEDHDFEEINYFNFRGKKVQWNSEQTGGVGRFATDGLQEVLHHFEEHSGTSRNAEYLKELFAKAYIEHDNLANATRYIANELFAEYGLVIIDADDAQLKRLFIPYVQRELQEQVSHDEVTKTIASFGEDYKVQVNPREINLFYLTDGLRERIVFEGGIYKVHGTNISWSADAILKELEAYPERFSPNVIMRPLYQEVILPNLCYIGGGGELAYWLELKSYFEKVAVPFPILLLRNSVQVISEKQAKKLENMQISIKDVFLSQNELLAKKVKENAEVTVDFTAQKNFLQAQFDQLRQVAQQTDVSFVGAVNAQERKQVKGLENLEKRLLRAEKRRQKDLVHRITNLQEELLPNHGLEERYRNFSEYYLEYGSAFIPTLKEVLDPLALKFTVLIL